MQVIATAAGPAHVHVDDVPDPRFLLVLTHGSAGGIDAPDLLAVRAVALEAGGVVARVMQPFRVAGGRAPGNAGRQDQAWLEVVRTLQTQFPAPSLIQGGRSNGARVACRTAGELGAHGVIALAFPLHPPGRPERSRVAELRAAATEVLVVNGSKDPFGVPSPSDASEVVVLDGATHALNRQSEQIREAVRPWLERWAVSPR